MRKTRSLLCLGLVAVVLSSCTDPGAHGSAHNSPPGSRTTNQAASSTVAEAADRLRVEEVVGNLEHGWDIGFLPDGQLLVTQRPGRLALINGTSPGATTTTVDADFSDVLVEGEGGLMGLAIDQNFADNRRFITCQTHKEGDTAVDVRLVSWTLSADGKNATKTGDLLTGLPINSSGRHSGCRPTIAADGALLVGTGDAANDPTIPQNRQNLGGKVLRIDAQTGEPLPDNPFISSNNPAEKRIYTYGHRNVQGVAVHPETNQVFTAEHGPTGFDELNAIRAGGNYGWDPSQGGAQNDYFERVPMTDKERFPDAVDALWTSGNTTEAPSGIAFFTGQQWGPLQNKLVMLGLRGQKMLVFTVDQGAVADVVLPQKFNDAYGRLRGVRSGPDGTLYVTTSNGDNDKLLKILPG